MCAAVYIVGDDQMIETARAAIASGDPTTPDTAGTAPMIYSRGMSTRILLTSARLDDAAAMDQFLLDIPNRDDLAKVLHNGTPVSSRAYDDETWTARFVASDGRMVKCFAVTDITIDQAEMIAAACVDISAWDESLFRETVAQSLGPTIDSAE